MHIGIVVNHQNTSLVVGQGSYRSKRDWHRLRRLVFDHLRQFHHERRSFARLALHTDRAPHHLTKMFGDRQPQAGAPKLARRRVIDLAEGLKQFGDLLGRHANARVADLEIHQAQGQRLKDFFNAVGARAGFSL